MLSRESAAVKRAAKKDGCKEGSSGDSQQQAAQGQCAQQRTNDAARTQLRPFVVLAEIIRTDSAKFASRT